MNLLAVIFLVGFALASAIPAPSQELSLNDADDLDLLLDFVLETEGDDETKTELGKMLKEKYSEFLEKLKDAIENGKVVKEEVLNRLKEIRQKLKDLKVDIGNKARDLLEKIGEKAKDYWKNILDKLKPQESVRLSERSEILEELVKTLKYALDKHLEWFKKILESGEDIPEKPINKLKEMLKKLKGFGLDISDKLQKFIETLHGKAKEKFQEIIDTLLKDPEIAFAEEEERSAILEDIVKTLKEALDKRLEWFKKKLESGEDIPEKPINKLKELLKKLKGFGLDISDKLPKFIETLHGKAKEQFQAILDTLMKDHEIAFAEEDDDVAILREKIVVFLRKVKEAIENDEKLNVEEISRQIVEQYLKLKNKGIELSEKDNDLIRLMGQKIKEYFQKQLEKIGKQERSTSVLKDKLRELREKIKEKFNVEAIKAGIEKIFGKGSEIGELLNKLVDENGEKAKQKILDFINKILREPEDKRSIKDVYERVKEYLKNMKIELKEKFSKFGEWAVAQYEKGLEKGKDRAENLKKLAKEFISKAKDMSRDVIEEAKDFFKEYKDDLGIVYDDVVAKFKEIVKS